jgi:hypothetical protein
MYDARLRALAFANLADLMGDPHRVDALTSLAGPVTRR